MMPHEGHVYLDRRQQKEWWLTNVISREHVRLADSDSWVLEFAHGMGFLLDMCADQPQPLYVESLFKTHVFERLGDGERMLMSKGGSGEFTCRKSLDNEMTRVKDATATIRIAGCGAASSFELSVFVVPRRANARAFWS